MAHDHPGDHPHELVRDPFPRERGSDRLDHAWSDRFHRLLLERIQSCEYPSRELMDRIEQMLSDRDQAVRYAQVLFDRITRYPSLHLLDRLAALILRIEDDC
ncbi:MAG TPA: hypothetical protein VHT91_20225 [Kofleriaceae bacterium]|jgi:hypothetical protein|nr:hypothetical protein [Kofleriaceae bacterium]